MDVIDVTDVIDVIVVVDVIDVIDVIDAIDVIGVDDVIGVVDVIDVMDGIKLMWLVNDVIVQKIQPQPPSRFARKWKINSTIIFAIFLFQKSSLVCTNLDEFSIFSHTPRSPNYNNLFPLSRRYL